MSIDLSADDDLLDADSPPIRICRHCTFRNLTTDNTCGMCDGELPPLSPKSKPKPKPKPQSKPSAASGGAAAAVNVSIGAAAAVAAAAAASAVRSKPRRVSDGIVDLRDSDDDDDDDRPAAALPAAVVAAPQRRAVAAAVAARASDELVIVAEDSPPDAGGADADADLETDGTRAVVQHLPSPAAAPALPPPPRPAAAPAPSGGEWTCSACTVVNPSDSKACDVCDQPRAAAAPVAPVNAAVVSPKPNRAVPLRRGPALVSSILSPPPAAAAAAAAAAAGGAAVVQSPPPNRPAGRPHTGIGSRLEYTAADDDALIAAVRALRATGTRSRPGGDNFWLELMPRLKGTVLAVRSAQSLKERWKKRLSKRDKSDAPAVDASPPPGGIAASPLAAAGARASGAAGDEIASPSPVAVSAEASAAASRSAIAAARRRESMDRAAAAAAAAAGADAAIAIDDGDGDDSAVPYAHGASQLAFPSQLPASKSMFDAPLLVPPSLDDFQSDAPTAAPAPAPAAKNGKRAVSAPSDEDEIDRAGSSSAVVDANADTDTEADVAAARERIKKRIRTAAASAAAAPASDAAASAGAAPVAASRKEGKAAEKKAKAEERARAKEAKAAEKESKKLERESKKLATKQLTGKFMFQEIEVLIDERIDSVHRDALTLALNCGHPTPQAAADAAAGAADSAAGGESEKPIIPIAYVVRALPLAHSILWRRRVRPLALPAAAAAAAAAGPEYAYMSSTVLCMSGREFEKLYRENDLHSTLLKAKTFLDAETGDSSGGDSVLTVFVYGMKQEIDANLRQNSKQRMHKAGAAAAAAAKGADKSKAAAADAAAFSFARLADAEDVMTDFWFTSNGMCTFRMITTPLDFGAEIYRVSKSLAEAPYKDNEIEYQMSANKPTKTKIQSNGWVKYLMQLSGVSDAKAKIVAAAYPNFATLMRAYERCSNERARIALLADLRNSGTGADAPFSMNGAAPKRLGPAVSQTIYENMFGIKRDDESEPAAAAAAAGAGGGGVKRKRKPQSDGSAAAPALASASVSSSSAAAAAAADLANQWL